MNRTVMGQQLQSHSYVSLCITRKRNVRYGGLLLIIDVMSNTTWRFDCVMESIARSGKQYRDNWFLPARMLIASIVFVGVCVSTCLSV